MHVFSLKDTRCFIQFCKIISLIVGILFKSKRQEEEILSFFEQISFVYLKVQRIHMLVMSISRSSTFEEIN